MKIVKGLLLISLCSVIIAGCAAKQTTAFRTFDATQSESVAIDAKQRVILVMKKGDSTKFCAEPSPDALAAIGASLTASGQSGEIEAMLQAAIAESASTFGVRNATIQLLRDGLYRLCEAHLNDAIDEKEYKRMANKYEDIMVTLLAIEKLTSMSNTKQNVVLSTDTKVKDPDEDGEDPSNDPTRVPNPEINTIEVENLTLSDRQTEIIARTVEKLVKRMFDYWELTYSEGYVRK